MMTNQQVVNRTVVAVVVVILVVAAVVVAIGQGREEDRPLLLREDIAACRAYGGEPHLVFYPAIHRFELEACWLPR